MICSLGLVLLLDLSSSIDPTERVLVLDGHANALRHELVVEGFMSQEAMVTVIAFAGYPTVIVPWTRIAGPDDLFDVAAAIELADPKVGLGTNIAHAVDDSHKALGEVECDREIVDIVTDAESDSPADVVAQFEDWQAINVLLVPGAPRFDVQTELRSGWGGFVLPIGSLREIEMGLTRKLIMELS